MFPFNNYQHISGTELHAVYPAGTPTVKVLFDNGCTVMGVLGPSVHIGPSPPGVKLPCPLHFSNGGELGLGVLPQCPNVQVAPPQPIIYLPFTITAGYCHRR